MGKRPMFIYVSGPYSSPAGEGKEATEQNIEEADGVARGIAGKGHFPFVPHTMMRGWQDTHDVPRKRVSEICHKWLEKCDALFFIGSSEGADSERRFAVKLGLPVYRNLDDVPAATLDAPDRVSPEALKAYLAEYAECMNSYRHTYATIWQAGALFAAISAAVIALAGVDVFPREMWVFTPLPLILWFLGIYLPMNRYGDLRSGRLADIECLLNKAVPGLQMKHFIEYEGSRKGIGFLEGIKKRKWRVRHAVWIFGLALILLQIGLMMWACCPQIKAFLSSEVNGGPQVREPASEGQVTSPVLPQSEIDAGPPR